MSNDWIQTYTGKKFFPLHPHQNEYVIEDIAHALSMKCRFAGHCNAFYSVAEHSVKVSRIVAPESQLWGLLHDAAEAYLPDVCQPIKSQIYIGSVEKKSWETPDQATRRWSSMHMRYFQEFRGLEDEILGHIAKVFGLPVPTLGMGRSIVPDDVKQADLILLATEARDLMGKPPEKWSLRVPVLAETIDPMTPREAEAEFLETFRRLTGVRP